MEQTMVPILRENRIVSLDMMRGFAILGIFLVNMLSFHSPILYMEPLEWWSNSIDRGIYLLIDIFVQASFYPLFSMLFGYGIVLLWERIKKKRIAFKVIIGRRLFLLLIIGLIHAFLIWHGDILFNYALFGFIFLFFIQLSGKRMIIIGMLLYLLPNLLLLGMFIQSSIMTHGEEMTLSVPYLASQSIDIYQNGTFLEITKQRIEDWSYTNNILGLFMMTFTILPLFIIGGGAAKYKWLQQIDKHRKIMTIAWVTSFLIGIILKVMPYIIDSNLIFSYIQDYFGGPLLAISYGLLIALLSEKIIFQRFLFPLANVGRMSLTNYLIQSIVSTLIFYHYGFGMYGKVSVLFGTVLVLVIYIGQIFLSGIWLKYFYYGPMEWLWRNFTYWKKQQWRKLKKNH